MVVHSNDSDEIPWGSALVCSEGVDQNGFPVEFVFRV